VIVWGETGCSFNGLRFQAFLTEIASHGIIIFANGSPTGGDNPNGIAETSNPNGAQLKSSIDFAIKNAGSGKYSNVDATRIAAAGQSCGGMQAYTQYNDPRVSAIGIFNSGFTDAKNTTPSLITKPIFYFLGGSTDIAYTNVSVCFSHSNNSNLLIRVNETTLFFLQVRQNGKEIFLLDIWLHMTKRMEESLALLPLVGLSGSFEETQLQPLFLLEQALDLLLEMDGQLLVELLLISKSHQCSLNLKQEVRAGEGL
jgi:hypothetical protein